ncbi:transposase [Streptomyces sp. 7R016]|uniref:Transposase n=1 Tax=Streptomyces spinosisporus TaxID=2927582 RepID=A0ABS9XY35_9ACTN|nr:transposase [Streptomyces spinosisporus]MCI3246517.1 transposase [Streptomyces spinosisporus]
MALALGGQAGERLAEHLAVPVSGPTLLRLIRAMDLPEVPELTVLGVDEFAFRRGRRFGAILIDMDSRRPVDVLPDHTADTFAGWLREHPHIGTVCRDRGGAFAEGAERGQPGMPQVAGRWHLLHNLATGLEKTVTRHRSCLKPPEIEPAPVQTRESDEESAYGRKIRERHRDVQALFQQGLTIAVVSARLGLDRKTVRRYAKVATAESLMRERPRRTSALTPHKPYPARRWVEGCDNAQTCATRSPPAATSGAARASDDSLTPWPGTTAPEPSRRHHPRSPMSSGGSSDGQRTRTTRPARTSKTCAVAARRMPRPAAWSAASPPSSAASTVTGSVNGSPRPTNPR